MYNDKTITYQTYKQTEDNLLEKIKNNNVKDVAKLPQQIDWCGSLVYNIIGG